MSNIERSTSKGQVTAAARLAAVGLCSFLVFAWTLGVRYWMFYILL
jgi:hypothetical protein